MLTKDVYLYEYMDGWERLNETSLPVKRKFYSSLNMEKMTNADYRQAKKAIFVIIMICMFKVTRYYLQTHSKVFAIGILKYMSLIQLTFCQHQD